MNMGPSHAIITWFLRANVKKPCLGRKGLSSENATAVGLCLFPGPSGKDETRIRVTEQTISILRSNILGASYGKGEFYSEERLG
jgi:hypothetical protein